MFQLRTSGLQCGKIPKLTSIERRPHRSGVGGELDIQEEHWHILTGQPEGKMATAHVKKKLATLLRLVVVCLCWVCVCVGGAFPVCILKGEVFAWHALSSGIRSLVVDLMMGDSPESGSGKKNRLAGVAGPTDNGVHFVSSRWSSLENRHALHAVLGVGIGIAAGLWTPLGGRGRDWGLEAGKPHAGALAGSGSKQGHPEAPSRSAECSLQWPGAFGSSGATPFGLSHN